jgi:protoporphyrin/coproporphyrin ferrochelatase
MNKSPAFAHGTPEKIAVVLLNLGTPDAPTPSALRKFLKEFLGDRRVVEIPRVIWWLILHGIILPIRSKKSAEKYASIWTPEGSPLRVWTEKQAKLLQGHLGTRGNLVTVRFAMTYGADNIASVLNELHAQNHTRILFMPLYPQYSATTTAAAFDAVYAWATKVRRLPEFRFINHYHDHPGYIAALKERVLTHWTTHGQLTPARGDKFVMSFHGVPKRTLSLGDPYHCEAYKTARLLSEQLGLKADEFLVTFQSRLGRAEWLQPYTEPSLIQLGKAGTNRVDVFCPGFTSDHLETLEEIADEGKAAFISAGGKEFNYIAALNDNNTWIKAMADIAEQHLQGWPTKQRADAARLTESAELAKRLGAAQ